MIQTSAFPPGGLSAGSCVRADESEPEGCLMLNERPGVGVSPGAALTPTCNSLRWPQASAGLLLLPLGHPSSSRLPGAARVGSNLAPDRQLTKAGDRAARPFLALARGVSRASHARALRGDSRAKASVAQVPGARHPSCLGCAVTPAVELRASTPTLHTR